VAVVAVELLVFFVPVNGVIPESEFYPATPAHRFLEANLGDARMGGTGWAFYPNSDMVYGLRDVRGHVFHLPDYRKLLLAVDPRVISGGTPTNAQFSPRADVSSPILDLLGVRYWAEGLDRPVRGRLIEVPRPDPSTSLDPAAGAETLLTVPAGGIR